MGYHDCSSTINIREERCKKKKKKNWLPFEVWCCISCQPTIVYFSPCFSWPDFVLELVQKLYGSQISDTKKMMTNKKDSPHSLIYTYLVFNYIKLGNCDVRILWLDPLLQQLVGLLYRILVNKDLFLYLIYPFLCFVSIFFSGYNPQSWSC